MDILIVPAIPFILAAIIAYPALRMQLGKVGIAWGVAGSMAALFVYLATQLPTISDGEILTYTLEWVPSLGLTLSLYMDGLALMFAMLVTGIGVAVFLYAGYYFDDDVEKMGRFVWQLLTFTGAMLSLVLAGNVLTLFIAWELTSITSFLLIGFYGNKDENARVSASRALIVTGGGGLALLVGLLLLAVATNDVSGASLFAAEGFELANILSVKLGDHEWYVAITALLMVGAFTKSAQWPFHFWLPGAMTAPSPASAFLHSATMVKAGIYLMYRMYPTLGNTDFWTYTLLFFGLTTMFVGALFALRQRDLKGLLAYTTVSKLGSMMALIALPDYEGLKAAAVGILAHAMYKGTLFLMTGTIEHSTGTRNLDELGGLRKLMPGAFIIAAVVGISMAGYPPLLGFVSKEVLLDAMLLEELGLIPIAVAFIASLFMVPAAGLYVIDVFLGKAKNDYHHFHAPHPVLQFGPALLAFMSIATGLLLNQTVIPLITPVVPKEFSLYLIPPEFVPAAQLSVAILIIGPLLFLARKFWLKMPWFGFIPTGQQFYAWFIGAVNWSGDQLLRSQGGKLRYYLIVILGSVSVIMAVGGFNVRSLPSFDITGTTDALRVLLLVLTVGAALASVYFKEHLLAALALGVSGYAVGGLFLVEPAPDVALVQMLVETLATVLIIMMVARIKTDHRRHVMEVLWQDVRNERNGIGMIRDITISVLIGGAVALFALAAVNERPEERSEINPPIAEWHITNAYAETGVTDVVSAILADFRATDTLIEIAVFAIAALAVLTLLTLPEGKELMRGRNVSAVMRNVVKSHNNEEERQVAAQAAANGDKDFQSAEATANPPPIPTTADEFGAWGDAYELPRMSTPLSRVVVTVLLPFALLISLTHVFYGGGAPGDGFTAGIVSGLAVASWYVVFGYLEARNRLTWLRPGTLISIGLLLAMGNAIMGIFVAEGFFNIYKFTEGGAGPAGLHLASTLIFEFSIFLTVFGGSTVIMEAIAHPQDVDADDPDTLKPLPDPNDPIEDQAPVQEATP